MNNDLVLPENLGDDIVKSLLDGTITEQQQGMLVKKIQVAMGANLLNSISSITRQYKDLDESISRILTQINASLDPATIATMDVPTLLSYYDRLTSIQAKSAELTRKVAQGKPLFDFPVLSDDERMVAQLMSSFTSQEEKREFLGLVKDWMSKKGKVDE